jgi:hypothetical protein
MIPPHEHGCLSGACRGRRWGCEAPGCLLPEWLGSCPQCNPHAFPTRGPRPRCDETGCSEEGRYRHADGFIYCASHHEMHSRGQRGEG